MLRHDKTARLLSKVAGKGGRGDASTFSSSGVDATISQHKHTRGHWASGTDLQPVIPVPIETKRPILADDFPKNLAEIVNAKYQALREEAHHTEQMRKTPSGEKAPSAETLVDIVPTGAGRTRLQAIADGLTSAKNTTGGDANPLSPKKVTFGTAKADKPVAVGQSKEASKSGCCDKCGAKCAKCMSDEKHEDDDSKHEKKEEMAEKKASAAAGAALGHTVGGPVGAALGAGAFSKKKDRTKPAFYAGMGSLGGSVGGALIGGLPAALIAPQVAVPMATLGGLAGGYAGTIYGARKGESAKEVGSKVRKKLKKKKSK